MLFNIGAGVSEGEIQRLEAGPRGLFGKRLPAKPHAPMPHPRRNAHPTPSPYAIVLDEGHVEKKSKAWHDLASTTSQLIFWMPRVLAERTAPAPSRQPSRRVPPRDAMLCGAAFNEDEVDWKVVAVLWSTLEDAVVVWYYDVEAVKAEEASTGKTTEAQEAEMMRFASAIAIASGEQIPGPCPGPLERPYVMEIRKWIYDGRLKTTSLDAIAHCYVLCYVLCSCAVFCLFMLYVHATCVIKN